MERWIEVAVGKMHVHKITQSDVAKKYGCKREFINRVLNGAVNPPKDAEFRIMKAIDELIASKL